MNIKKLTEYKGASRFENCTECGEMESDAHRLYRLQFNGVSICLCPSCFVKTRAAMNNVVIDPYDFIGRELGDIKVGGLIGITKEMLEGEPSEG